MFLLAVMLRNGVFACRDAQWGRGLRYSLPVSEASQEYLVSHCEIQDSELHGPSWVSCIRALVFPEDAWF